MGKVCNLCNGTDISKAISVYNVVGREDNTLYDLLRCTSCRFVFLDPDKTANQDDCYGDDYYSFSPLRRPPLNNPKAQTRDARLPRRILDVGCGSGHWIYQKQLEGFDAWGLENDSRAVRAAQSIGLDVVSEPSELPDDAFDWVRLSHVLEHTSDPTGMLLMLKTKMKKGGTIEILVPNIESAKFDLIPEVSKLVDVPRHLVFFSEPTLRRILQKTEFSAPCIEFCAAPNDLREMLGDIRRLFLYIKKARPRQDHAARVLFRILYVRLRPSCRVGPRNDWIRAEARRSIADR